MAGEKSTYDFGKSLGDKLGNNGRPGGWPGAGRPPSAVRDACKKAFDKRIPLLEKIADDKENRSKDRIDAIKCLGQYGLGQHIEVSLSNNEVLAVIARVTAKFLPEDSMKDWISECRKAIKEV